MTRRLTPNVDLLGAVSVFVATFLILGIPDATRVQAQGGPQTVTIKEYGIPNSHSLTGITVGSDGAFWIADSTNFGTIWRRTISGDVTDYPLSGAPEFTALGSDGAVWFSQAFSNQIGRISTSGAITEYPLPSGASYPLGIVSGPDGSLWFAEFMGNRIGRITTSGVITEYPLPVPNGNPNMIAVGSDGALWFTENYSKIGRMTTAGVFSEFSPPVCFCFGITSGPDGRLWFAGGDVIGAITTAGVITEYPLTSPPPPSGSHGLAGITKGPDGALWFTEMDADKIGRITTAGVISEYPVPTPDSMPSVITSGPDGSVWFTEAGVGQLGQALLGKSVTSTLLTSSLNPSIYGQKVSWTTTVTTTGSVTPTGNVSFRWSNGGRTFTIGTAALNASGIATLTRSNLNADPFGVPYPMVAVYLGDAANLSSTSTVLAQTVQQAKTAAKLTSSANPSTEGQAVMFTAQITSPTVTATGPVTFSIGSTVLGTAQLSGGKARFTTAALPVGTNSVKATYFGNSNIGKSSATFTQAVQ
jgi:streptogramin lyase